MRLAVDIKSRLRSPDYLFELDVRFDLEEELAVVFGPSGAGKSVTLQAIAGLVSPDVGVIRFGDDVLFDADRRVDVPARDRRFGYVFQDYALFPHRTVQQNVAAPLAPLFGHRLGAEERKRVEMLLSAFDLAAISNSYPSQISGGQRQRTALARALAASPRLLLLDEPFNALDTDLRGRMRREVLDMHERFGVPILLITHDEADVRMFGRQVVRLDAGRVVADARAETAMCSATGSAAE